MVCEGGQCVPGCAERGGIQCTGGMVCQAATGRWLPNTFHAKYHDPAWTDALREGVSAVGSSSAVPAV